jgi:hypothetical protein
MWQQLKKLSKCTCTRCSSRHYPQGESDRAGAGREAVVGARHLLGARLPQWRFR